MSTGGKEPSRILPLLAPFALLLQTKDFPGVWMLSIQRWVAEVPFEHKVTCPGLTQNRAQSSGRGVLLTLAIHTFMNSVKFACDSSGLPTQAAAGSLPRSHFLFPSDKLVLCHHVSLQPESSPAPLSCNKQAASGFTINTQCLSAVNRLLQDNSKTKPLPLYQPPGCWKSIVFWQF